MDNGEKLATAAMYALRALIDGLRADDRLPVDAIERSIQQQLNTAFTLEAQHQGKPSHIREAQAIRHGMFWLRECVKPSKSDCLPAWPPIPHPASPYDWPELGEPWPK